MAALLLWSCKDNGFGSATPLAAEQFAALVQDLTGMEQAGVHPDSIREINDVVLHFRNTADARYASEKSGLTMLHLASMFKHPELARCLLLDGANPNAMLRDDFLVGVPQATPLMATVLVQDGDTYAAQTLELVKILLKAGATVNMHQLGPLCETENVYIELLRHANNLEDQENEDFGGKVPVGMHAASMGWDKALAELLKRRGGKFRPADGVLLHASSNLKCMELLLNNGVNVDTQDSVGATALFILAINAAQAQGTTIDMLELLLKKGANVHHVVAKDPEYPGYTPYDFLISRPELIQELQNRGIVFPPSAINWENSDNLPREICRAHMREILPQKGNQQHIVVSDDIKQHLDIIASMLKPDSVLRQNPLYPDALSAAIHLLAAADSARASQEINALPLWADEIAWKDQHPHVLATLSAVLEAPGVILQRERIAQTAEMLMKLKRNDEAASIIELLSRCPDAEADIERYIADKRPAIQAGAYHAKLRRLGLPEGKCFAVSDWLKRHGREANTPILKKAVLLTSQEELWFNEMTPENRQALLAAMEEIGAPQAAAKYRQISENLNNPDQLDAITADSHSWKFELEIATARFLLQHQQEFQTQP